MMHLAQLQRERSIVYRMDHDWDRLAELEQDVVSHGQIAYRAEVSVGAAQGQHGEVMTIVRQVTKAIRGRAVLDLPRGIGSEVSVKVLGELSPVWLANLSRLDISRSPEVLKQTMDSLLANLVEKGPDFVNEKLAQIDVEAAHASHLMAVLRGLFAWRGQMSNWNKLRDRAAAELTQRSFKLDVIMKGLLN